MSTADTFATLAACHGKAVSASSTCKPGVSGALVPTARCGAPTAAQVTDRWHLLHNLGDALARAFDRHRRDLRAAAAATVQDEVRSDVSSGIVSFWLGPQAA